MPTPRTHRIAPVLAAVLLTACGRARSTAAPDDAVAIVDGVRIDRAELADRDLQRAIDRVLIRAEAERLGIVASPADVDRVVANIADNHAETPAQLRQRVEQDGRSRSWAAYREALRDDLLLYQIVLHNPGAKIREEEVRAVYDEMVRGMTGEEIPRYAHIRHEIRRQMEVEIHGRIQAETLGRLRRDADIRILDAATGPRTR